MDTKPATVSRVVVFATHLASAVIESVPP